MGGWVIGGGRGETRNCYFNVLSRLIWIGFSQTYELLCMCLKHLFLLAIIQNPSVNQAWCVSHSVGTVIIHYTFTIL